MLFLVIMKNITKNNIKKDKMNLTELTAISPVDGRYRSKIKELYIYFSEFGLIRYRVMVEIEYFIALCDELPQLKNFEKKFFVNIREIYENFSLEDAKEIKEIEKITNHDVKAVEYFIKKKFSILKMENFKEFIHFGLTSQDINNTAIPYSLKDGLKNVYYPILEELIIKLNEFVILWKDVPMIARTHGQTASPTRVGKEIKVFSERIEKQVEQLKNIPYSAKFGGATGNFNAHYVAYPEIDWIDFADNFCFKVLKLDRSKTTTQIEHYDNIASLFDALKRINNILIDFSRDIWTYISMDYFKQTIKDGEIGSSAMPHKVNPIDFENAEGNLGMANAIFEHISAKLPISRLQRDLTDSTVLRNIGVPISHTLIAFKSILKGMDKLILNKEKIEIDLENNWNVVAEAIQTILRRENYPNPYEILKNLTRKNVKIDKKVISDFIDKLEINEKVKNELKKIKPSNYTGIF